MRRLLPFLRACCNTLLAITVVGISLAAVTPEQKKELKEIGTEIGKATSLTSKKKFDEAEAALNEVEGKFEILIKDAAIPETDPALKPIRVQLEKAKAQLGKASGKGTVSFVKDVAPILAAKCVSCHDDNARGGLRLDTFAGMEKGGTSGLLLVPGNAQNSRLVQRLVTPNAQQRMPKSQPALSANEIQSIGTWVAEGAKFDGADKATELASLGKRAAGPAPKVEIAKPTGKETVSFIKDVAPTIVNICGGCHNDGQKRGGLSMASFEKLMQGGDSGRVIVAYSLEGSRLWRLVNADETPVMPAGQARITRKWHGDLKKWIEEGAKFDGSDPKRPLRQQVPTEEELAAQKLALLSPEEFAAKRLKDSEAQWKQTFPNGEPRHIASKEFIVMGDVSEDRLKEIETWAIDHAKSLRSSFNVKDDLLWKGKLTIFVFKERFGYEEFNNSVQKREVPREVLGHSQVTSTMEEAFIALQDIGDAASESSPGIQVSLVEHLTGAFLKRGGGTLPDWVIRGAGLSLAGRGSAGNPYLAALPSQAGAILKDARIAKPEDVFANGTFAPGEVGPIGFTLVNFMMTRGGPNNFGQFVRSLQGGDSPEAALKKVYNADGKSLAVSYSNSLPAGGAKKGKK
jgi:mono/diheme cytochrome c family protein